MASRPRDVLRTLPDDPHLWELAAATMSSAHPTGQVAAHLVAHAPSGAAFATGMATIAEDPTQGIGLAVAYGATADYIAGLSEHYGLSPTETAVALSDTGSTPQVIVETLWERCDHDTDATSEVAVDAAHLEPRQINRCLAVSGITSTGDTHLSAARMASTVSTSATPTPYWPCSLPPSNDQPRPPPARSA